jgi:hypothetical protein
MDNSIFINPDYENVIKVVRNNSQTYTMYKVFEEMAEFQEVLTKLQTKRSDKKPPLEEAIKEYGDVVYRGLFALLALNPEASVEQITKAVETHISSKLIKLNECLTLGKYKGEL